VKVLVYPHATEIGGSQLNAVEIAAATRDRGHDVLVISRDGPLVDIVQQLGLSHVLLDPRARRRPSRHAAAQLTRLARQHGIDVVHGYEWPPAVESFAGPRLRLGLPVVFTVNSMSVAPFLPRSVPLVVCTDETRLRALQAGHSPVTLLDTPVDVRANTPEYDPGTFRSGLGLDVGVPLVVVVSRLVPELKLEGLLAACDAVGELASGGTPVQLAVVGDGPSRSLVGRAADVANARAGRRAVVLAGQMEDPRPAYAAADVMLGMGGSALRGLAFAKPLVVQGERGFWELLTPDTAPRFLRQGFYGLGAEQDGRAAGALRLTGILRELLDEPATWARLGRYGRSLVLERYSLEQAAAAQEEVYAAAIAAMAASDRPSAMGLAAEAGRTGIGVFQHKVARKWRRWRGTAPVDDFNAVTGMRRGGEVR
jgi:glycosyltransferase involved in cell wall biosynthesis